MEVFEQVVHGFAVVGIAGSNLDIEQFTLVINHQMELEAKEPIDRGFATSGQASKHLVASNPAVMAYLEAAAIDEADAGTGTKTVLQIHAQRQQGRRHPFYKAVVADQAGKCLSPVHTDMLAVERFVGGAFPQGSFDSAAGGSTPRLS